MNTLRHLLQRARIGHVIARGRTVPDSLSEEFEVLVSSASVDDVGAYRTDGRRLSS